MAGYGRGPMARNNHVADHQIAKPVCMTSHKVKMVHPYFKLASRHNVEAYLNRAKRSSKSPRGILPPAMSWTIPGLCAAYGWPAGNAPGRGVIGIVELGGGWLQS